MSFFFVSKKKYALNFKPSNLTKTVTKWTPIGLCICAFELLTPK